MPLSHSLLVRQNCTVPHGPTWHDDCAVPAFRSYAPQHTCPLWQSAASRQCSDALLTGHEAVAPEVEPNAAAFVGRAEPPHEVLGLEDDGRDSSPRQVPRRREAAGATADDHEGPGHEIRQHC